MHTRDDEACEKNNEIGLALVAPGECFSIIIDKKKKPIADTLEVEHKLIDVGKILSNPALQQMNISTEQP